LLSRICTRSVKADLQICDHMATCEGCFMPLDFPLFSSASDLDLELEF